MASRPEFRKETTSEQVVDHCAEKIRGRSVIITGVSPNGLAEAMARAIASKGPSLLVLAARSTSKAESVSKQLGVEFPSIKIRLLSLDLSPPKVLRQAATELGNITKSVDALINNAEVTAVSERTFSDDGEENQFATNYLGHFLFTNLIMNELLFSANQAPQSSARIVNIASAGHALTSLRISNHGFKAVAIPYEERPNTAIASQMGMLELDPQGGYHAMIAHCHFNTANVLFKTELSQK